MPAIVGFVSQKGGVGKSTLARALAAVAAHAGLNVLLADLDAKQQSLVEWYRTRAAGDGPSSLTVGAFSEVADAVTAAADADILIIDTPGGVDRNTLAIARVAHLTVLPTGPSRDDLHPTVLLLHELAAAGIARSQMVTALCRVLSAEEEAAARNYLERSDYEVLPGSVPESAVYRVAQNRGQALTEVADRTARARADALMEALLERVAAPAGEQAPGYQTSREAR